MVDPVCVATLSGTDCAPLVLQVRRVALHEDGSFEIAALWNEQTEFIEALTRKYDRLSIAWYDTRKGVDAVKTSETVYMSSAPFAITGDLVVQGDIAPTFSLATIQVCARQAVTRPSRPVQDAWNKHTCPHDWRYSAGTGVKVSGSYPFRYCVLCGELVVDGKIVKPGVYPDA